MLASLILQMFACVPMRSSFCTREYNPVCGNATTYSNVCMAQAAGFYGSCERFVTRGECANVEAHAPSCRRNEFLSEKGMCVPKPWSDFQSCEIEKNQGACSDGTDPNRWVSEHCAETCGTFVRTNRVSDGNA